MVRLKKFTVNMQQGKIYSFFFATYKQISCIKLFCLPVITIVTLLWLVLLINYLCNRYTFVLFQSKCDLSVFKMKKMILHQWQVENRYFQTYIFFSTFIFFALLARQPRHLIRHPASIVSYIIMYA